MNSLCSNWSALSRTARETEVAGLAKRPFADNELGSILKRFRVGLYEAMIDRISADKSNFIFATADVCEAAR